jgi:hypothetical protein
MTHRSTPLIAVLAAALTGATVVGDDANDGIDAEGYVCAWLVLAPISLKDSEKGASALEKDQVKGEANLKPQAGDTLDVDGKHLAWNACHAKEQILDFNSLLGKQTENSVGYAVAYITAEADIADVTLMVGSDDQIKVYLNGNAIHSNDEDRPLEKDEDNIAGLSLKKGRNVLVVKVVNEEEDWAMSARFVDKDGKPITGLKATTKGG